MAIATESFWRRLRYTRLRNVVRGRFDGQLDWRCMAAEADLPLMIADTISRIVDKSRLWKGERFDVAQELVSHFQDGLEAGIDTDKLLASFGDVKNTAQLIRRSKRRGRPLIWQAWWWTSRSMAALLVTYILFVFLLAFDQPTISTDYRAILSQRYVSGPKENFAWPHYQRALEWLKANVEAPADWPDVDNVDDLSVGIWLTGPKDGETRLLDDEYHHLDEAQQEVVDAWLDERAEFLTLLRKATKYQRLGVEFGNYSPQFRRLFGMFSPDANDAQKESWAELSLFNTLLPHIQAMHDLTRVLKADMQRSIQHNDSATAFADLQAMIGIVRHSGDNPWLMCGGVECGLLNSVIDNFERVQTTHPETWTDRQLVEAAHLLGAIRPEASDYIQGEKSMFYDIVQRLYSDNGSGDGYLTAEGLRLLDHEFRWLLGGCERSLNSHRLSNWLYLASAPASYFLGASRQELIAKHDDAWLKIQAETDRPLWDPMPAEKTLHAQSQRWSEIERIRFGLVYSFLPGYQTAAMKFEKMKGRLDGALIGIALELYHREHGAWPESLKRLSPMWLPEVPIDRLSGGALFYRIVDGQPLVYSVGVDGDDDQGRVPMVYDTPTPLNAAPNYVLSINRHLRTNPHYDGDWVIWSTAKAEAGLEGGD